MGWEIRNDNGTNQASLNIGNIGGIIIRNRRPSTSSGRPEPVEGRFTRNALSGAFATNRHE